MWHFCKRPNLTVVLSLRNTTFGCTRPQNRIGVLPFGYTGDLDCYAWVRRPSVLTNTTVLYEGPRLLVLLVTKGHIKIGLVSGHCPHATRHAERDAFLACIQPLLQRLKHVSLILGGVDLNGRIPTNFPCVSGSLELGEADEAGWQFASILADAGIWVPSMYTQLHCGESATYTHPNGQQHRIDYTLVGGQAVIEQVRSEVDDTFDNGSPQDDHMLLVLGLHGS